MTSAPLSNTRTGWPRVVGLTGGIGCGKSLARELFEALGVPCIDADQVARKIHQNPAHPAMREVANAFPGMVADNGSLKRGSLHALFAIDPMANRRLKEIFKPYVMDAMCHWTGEQRKPYVIWESALILDENIPVDRILVVNAQQERRMARIRNRNPDWNDAQILNIFAIQMTCEAYLAGAQDVLSNDASKTELQQQVQTLHGQYMAWWG